MSHFMVGNAGDIPEEARRELVQFARRALMASAAGEPHPIRTADHPLLQESDFGAFVTLRTRDGALRGCVGCMLPEEPLWQMVSRMTRAAALDDPRFPPVTTAEVADVQISISLVFPLAPLHDPTLLRIGEHGLYIENGFKRGVFLPQVPVEQGWDPQEFLRQTCRKANLGEDAWQQPGTKVACFTTRVIEEES